MCRTHDGLRHDLRGTRALLATRIAPHHDWSVMGMTGLLVAGAAGSLIASRATDAPWSQWTALMFMAPSACFAPLFLGHQEQRCLTQDTSLRERIRADLTASERLDALEQDHLTEALTDVSSGCVAHRADAGASPGVRSHLEVKA